MRHADIILKEITSNDTLLTAYTEGLDLLIRSRIFEYLRAAYIPILFDNGSNVHVNASQAALNAGYHKALDDIMTFREQLVADQQKGKMKLGAPDWGGAEHALSKKYLTKEELDAVARGITPRYDPKTGHIKPES